MASLARNSLMTDLGFSWSKQTVLQYQKNVATATNYC